MPDSIYQRLYDVLHARRKYGMSLDVICKALPDVPRTTVSAMLNQMKRDMNLIEQPARACYRLTQFARRPSFEERSKKMRARKVAIKAEPLAEGMPRIKHITHGPVICDPILSAPIVRLEASSHVAP